MVVAESSLEGRLQAHHFNHDTDAARKRRFKVSGDNSVLPDYRYVVQSENISATELPSVLRQLPDYADASLAPH